MHSGLGLVSEEDEGSRTKKKDSLDADLVIVDEFSMVDMWLAGKFFSALKKGAKTVLVGDPDQLPSVGAGNVFKELIQCGLVPVTVLDEIFRQAKDSFIAHNARLIHDGNTKLYYGNDFQFLPCDNQEDAAAAIIERYCQEIENNGIEHVQILSPFRTEGAASSDHLNAAIREIVNPFRSTEDEIRVGSKTFRIGDRIMQTKNTDKVSNGDLGFIRYMEDTPEGKRIGLEFGENRSLEYSQEDLVNLDLAYATTIHKAMGSGRWSMEFDEHAEMTSCTWSDVFRNMLGYKNEQDFPNRLESWSDLLHDEDRERVIREYWDTVRDYSGEKTYDVEYHLLTKNAGWRCFHAAGRLSRREDGSPITFVDFYGY